MLTLKIDAPWESVNGVAAYYHRCPDAGIGTPGVGGVDRDGVKAWQSIYDVPCVGGGAGCGRNDMRLTQECGMPCVYKSRVGALCEGGSVAARVARAHDRLHIRQRQHRHLVTIHRHVSHIDSTGAVLSG